MFSGAEQTLISGGTFTSIHAPVTNNQIYRENGIKLLRRKVASGAFHNSAERYDPPKCHPGTREMIISEIMAWIKAIDKEEFFLWLYGPAGAGKSAIAQSIAELCHKAGLLAATFFFSRTAAGRNDATLLIPTLAYQLTVPIPEIIEHISKAIEKDTLIFTRSLEAQLEALIIEPLSKLIPESKARPRFIIIDGLDECGQPKTQGYILTSLSSAVQRYRIPLFFLIASRPEQEIRDVFNDGTMTLLTRRLVLDDTYKPDADIKVFLASKFAKIKQSHPLASTIPPPWPSVSDLDHLIQKASGQFIYASTVIKFVESSRHRPTDRLDIVFGLKTPGKQTPFAELDALYTLIFASVEDIEAVIDVFMFLLLFPGSTFDGGWRSLTVEVFWFYQPGDLQIILANLHSVISVPLLQSVGHGLRLFHASLGDFLMDKSRSGRFFIDAPKAHARMAEYCIRHASTMIEFRSPNSRTRSLFFSEMLRECLNAYPTKELLQALRYFRFDLFLALQHNLSSGRGWRHTLVDLSLFLDWIQQNCSQTHVQECLCNSYMAHIDHHLRARLSDCPLSDPRCQYLFTASTLHSSSCAFKAFDFWYIVDRSKMPQEYITDLINRMDPFEGCNPNSCPMLIAFLTDQVRSGWYYRDKSKYIDLAKECMDYLCRPIASPHTRPRTDKCALIITLEILSRFPRDHQLIKILCVINPNWRDPCLGKEIASTISAYIKDYELSRGAYPTEQDLPAKNLIYVASNAMK